MTATRTAAGLFELTRPLNTLITGLTVVVGGLIAGKGMQFEPAPLIGAAIAAALIAAGANAMNDAYDAVIDMINRPERPIPSGEVSRILASFWGFSLTLAGVIAGRIMSLTLGLVPLLVAILLWFYNSRLKRRPLTGNVVVAICGGLAFIYGGMAVGHIREALIPAGFAFLLHLGREIVKDVEDLPGDLAVGARTLPIATGRKSALSIASGVLILLAVTTFIPYIAGIYSHVYMIMVGSLTAAPLLVIAFFLLRNPEIKQLGRISLALKIIMLTGLAALYAG